MALIIDPIESDINSLLGLFTSQVATSTDSSDNDPTISTAATPLASSVIIITPIGSSQSSSSSSSAKTTTAGKSTSSGHTSSLSSASAKTSPSSNPLSATPTTLLTSTVSTSTGLTTDSSTSTSSSTATTNLDTSTSSTSSATPIPTPFPSAPPAAAAASSPNTNSNTSSSPAPISTAGIIIAIIFTVALIVSILWLVARFCPPVRSRIDAWTARRRRERSYREAIDGPAVPEKDTGSEPYSASSDRSHERDKHFSFFALGRNPPLINTTSSRSAIVHQQFISPDSASTPRGHGLGLGRVSLLRSHSLLRKAGHDVPEMPQMDSVVMDTRKSVAGARPLPVPEQENARQSHAYTAKTSARDRNIPLPRLHVDIPNSGTDASGSFDRVSQIGVAVTGTPVEHHRR